MFELVEPISVIPYSVAEPNESMFALGFSNYWDTRFAGRAAPLDLASGELVEPQFGALLAKDNGKPGRWTTGLPRDAQPMGYQPNRAKGPHAELTPSRRSVTGTPTSSHPKCSATHW
jgi:hypothetical protein